MKTRNGFVSNSSSSSFLLVYNDIGAFAQFKESQGYEYLERELNRGKKRKKAVSEESDSIEQFFTELVESFAGEYGEYLYANSHPDKRRYYYCDCVWSLEDELKKYNLDESVQSGIDGLVKLVKNVVENWDISEDLCDWKVVDKCHDIIDMLVLQILNSIENNWKYVSVFEVGDDSDYGGYIEHTFMPRVISKSGNGFAGLSISHH